LKKIKLSATVAFPAAMADPTGKALLPPAPDLPTTALKSPKKRDNLAAAVGHGTTDASIPSKSKYPSCRNAGRKTTTAVGASSHLLDEDDVDPIIPANLVSLAAKKLHEKLV
jgi:hypothetical protein